MFSFHKMHPLVCSFLIAFSSSFPFLPFHTLLSY